MQRPQAPLELRLYLNGHAPESAGVEDQLHRLFASVGLEFTVEVIDVNEHPDRADDDRILLTPTLLRLTPPRLRVAGDLSDLEAALDGLGLRVWSQRQALA
ncbi:MAG: circadian clock protein KaiB [Actinobacteria bacterium]|jgi:circadian clock protein KaiB|nr:circadian clock protein KaiB [Actinomycetota bacterium]